MTPPIPLGAPAATSSAPAARGHNGQAPAPAGWSPTLLDLPAIVAAVTAILALSGWFTGVDPFGLVLRNSPPMKANTALAFLVLAVAFYLDRRRTRAAGRARVVSMVLGVLVLGLALATFAESVTSMNLGIDQLIAHDRLDALGPPGRMRVNTTLCIASLALALLLLGRGARRFWPSEWLAAVVVVITLFALIGDFFGGNHYPGLLAVVTSVVPATALALFALAVAAVVARTRHLGFRLVRRRDAGSRFLLTFGPLVLVLPVAFGIVVVAAAQRGEIPLGFGLSLGTLLTMVGGMAATVVVSVWIRKVEREARARREESVFRTLVETANEGVWLTDRSRKTTFMNQRLLEMLGYEASELIGEPAILIAHPQFAADAELRATARSEGRRESYEGAFVRKDGSTLWAIVSASPNFDDEGQPAGSLAMVTDITARRAAEADVRFNEQRFRALFEEAGVGMAITSPAGVLLECNPALCQLLGRPASSLVGEPFETMTTTVDRPQSLAMFAELQSGRGTYTIRKRFARADGSELEVQVVVTRVEREDGGWVAMAVVHDLTEVQRADRADRERLQQSQFLARMSHELRTPLNGILGFSELLASGGDALTETQSRYVENVRRSGEQLLALVTSLLDLTQAASDLEVATVSLNLATVTARSVGLVEQEALVRGLEIHVDVDDTLSVRADEVRLQQVLVCLLANAVKFTLTGSVTVLGGRDGRFVTVAVTDTGIGIEEHNRERIFEDFFQVQEGAGRAAGGAGIGLPLSRRLIEIMGGWIDVHSAVEGGATFTVHLPSA